MHQRLTDPLQGNVTVLVTPFTAYLLAEAVGASGALAVVLGGLILSQTGPRLRRAATRQQSAATWSLATYVLNGALFVLVGIDLHPSVRGLTSTSVARALTIVAVVLVVVRIA